MQATVKFTESLPFKADADVDVKRVATPVATPYIAAADRPHATSLQRICRPLQLIPFHVLNFGLGIVGVCAEVVGISVAIALLPLTCFGISACSCILRLTRVLATADVGLANRFAPIATACNDDLPLTITPSLFSTISVRSSMVVLYFLTVKVRIGMESLASVSLSFFPILYHAVASAVGAEDDAFNWHTEPVGFVFSSFAFFVGGLVTLRGVAIVSRAMTRRVCCLPTTLTDGTPV